MGSIPRQFGFVFNHSLLSGISIEHCQVLLCFILVYVYLQVTTSPVFPSSSLPVSQGAKFEERSSIRTLFSQGLKYCFSSIPLLMSAKIHQVLDPQVGSVGYPVSNMFLPDPRQVFMRHYDPGKTFAICYMSSCFACFYLVSKDLKIVKFIKLDTKLLYGLDCPKVLKHKFIGNESSSQVGSDTFSSKRLGLPSGSPMLVNQG